MGRSGTEGRCKKHPKHTQSPGVCSLCLAERLSQLSSSGSAVSASCSSSYMSSNASASASSASSPPHLRHLSSTAAATKRRTSFPATAARGVFGRSRSVAVVVGREGEGEGGVEKNKKGGFWSKLLRASSRRRKKEGFLHSKTTKEAAANSALSRK